MKPAIADVIAVRVFSTAQAAIGLRQNSTKRCNRYREPLPLARISVGRLEAAARKLAAGCPRHPPDLLTP
jgi:hypothetical protein